MTSRSPGPQLSLAVFGLPNLGSPTAADASSPDLPASPASPQVESPTAVSGSNTFVAKAKRRFSEHGVAISLPSLRALTTQVTAAIGLPKVFSPAEPLRGNTIAPPTHRENIALHALLDSLPVLPTLSAISLPFRFGSKKTSASGLSLSAADNDSSGDSDEDETGGDDPLARLTGNVVVLGGYRGSILRDAKTGKRLWMPLKVGLGLRNPDLELRLGDEDELRSRETIVPGGMLMAVAGLVDLGKKLKDKLKYLSTLPAPPSLDPLAPQRPRIQFHNWGYDWRRRLELSSEELLRDLQKMKRESAARGEGRDGQGEGATVIAHSMGGLVVLHALARAEDPTIFKGILFAGTPFHGCINVLGPLRNGDGMLFNREIGAPRVVFSMRSSFYFLNVPPGCFELPTGEALDVDLLDAKTWSELNLSPVSGALFSGGRDHPPREKGAELGHGEVLSLSLTRGEDSEGEVEAPVVVEGGEGDGEGNERRKGSRRKGSGDELTTAEGGESSTPMRRGSGRKGSRDEVLEGGDSSEGSRRKRVDSDKDDDNEIAAYLIKTLERVQAFHASLSSLYDPAKAALYPPMTILTSQKTPTVSGVITPSRAALALPTCYDHLLFAPGDGIVTYDSAKDLPGGPDRWNRHLVGVEESPLGHVSLLGDLESVRRCLEKLYA